MKPRNIGRYQIKAELNRGGMSVVYLAHDPRFGRDVAIKMLPRSLQDQPAVRARFEREARTVAALEHPAIVPVYDFGEEDGQPYLVMRCMQGGSLADLLTYGRLNLTDAARITTRIAGALDEAHERGVIHRDLKPGNILFDTHGEAFLTDFGIVKLYEGDSAMSTMTGSVVLGTPAYMSPEQALGKTIDRRSDVYSLGAVLYEMLTGLPPYKGPTSISIAMKHVVEPVPNVREYRPDLPDACIAVVEKAMAKEADARFATAGELADAFAASALSAAPTEKQMPPVVVRRKPQTTSSAVRVDEDDGASADTPTTEASRPVTGAQPQAEPGGIRWGLIATVVAIGLLLLGAGVAALGVLSRQTRPTPTSPASPTTAAPVGPTVIATTVVVPTREPPPPPTNTSPPEATEAPAPAPEPTLTLISPPAPNVPTLRVTIDDGRVRAGPGTGFSILRELPRNTELRAIAFALTSEGRWYEVVLQDNVRGWVSETIVVPVNPEAVNALPTAAFIPPSPTPTATLQPTATATLIPTPTATLTPTPTVTPTPTITPSPTLSPTPVPLPTSTPTVAPLPTSEPPLPTVEPTLTATATGTSVP
jgi:serine/threonine-protein kinase